MSWLSAFTCSQAADVAHLSCWADRKTTPHSVHGGSTRLSGLRRAEPDDLSDSWGRSGVDYRAGGKIFSESFLQNVNGNLLVWLSRHQSDFFRTAAELHSDPVWLLLSQQHHWGTVHFSNKPHKPHRCDRLLPVSFLIVSMQTTLSLTHGDVSFSSHEFNHFTDEILVLILDL